MPSSLSGLHTVPRPTSCTYQAPPVAIHPSRCLVSRMVLFHNLGDSFKSTISLYSSVVDSPVCPSVPSPHHRQFLIFASSHDPIYCPGHWRPTLRPPELLTPTTSHCGACTGNPPHGNDDQVQTSSPTEAEYTSPLLCHSLPRIAFARQDETDIASLSVRPPGAYRNTRHRGRTFGLRSGAIIFSQPDNVGKRGARCHWR